MINCLEDTSCALHTSECVKLRHILRHTPETCETMELRVDFGRPIATELGTGGGGFVFMMQTHHWGSWVGTPSTSLVFLGVGLSTSQIFLVLAFCVTRFISLVVYVLLHFSLFSERSGD
jgi:hypothetical protein